MFRKSLLKNINSNNIFLSNSWCKEIEGLVRMPFFDINDEESGYVVYYNEVRQQYGLIKYSISNGETIWESNVVNGGYGTAVVYQDIIIILKEFNGIAAFDKYNGDLLWEFSGDGRVRNSINIIDNLIVFASAGDIFFMDKLGSIKNKISFKGMFFYGTISRKDDHYIAMGTKFNKEINDSCLNIIAFDSNGNLLYEINLGDSYVISSDTSGFWIENDYIYVNHNNEIIMLNANNGEIVWKREVNGISGRHVPVVDKDLLFYTTLLGEIGCLKAESGKVVWSLSTQEGSIVSPPSVYNGTLLVLADCSLYLINKITGEFYSKKAVGHSPYSAITIFKNNIIVGGGEPPLNGALMMYHIGDKNENTEYFQNHFEVGNYVESNQMQIIINCRELLTELSLDASIISPTDNVKSKTISENLFVFDFNLKNNNLSGYYALPISYNYNGEFKTEMISIYLFKKDKLPNKFRLNKFFKNINQTSEFNSGAAIAESVFNEYGKKISQEEFRRIIEHVKSKSNWKDADFQTWRLILKRVLSSPARTFEEFIELEELDN